MRCTEDCQKVLTYINQALLERLDELDAPMGVGGLYGCCSYRVYLPLLLEALNKVASANGDRLKMEALVAEVHRFRSGARKAALRQREAV